MNTNQLVLPSNGANVASFYNSEDLSDCTLKAEYGEAIYCHKLTLSAGSAVFKAMFSSSSDMKEANSNIVAIKDADPAVLQCLVRHLYGQEVQVQLGPCLVDLYQLADMYQVTSATTGLEQVIHDAKFSLESIKQVMPLAVGLGSAGTPVRTLLAQKAAAFIQAILKEPEVVQVWELLEVSEVLKTPCVPAYESLLLIAAWAQDNVLRARQWLLLQAHVNLQGICYEQLRQLQNMPDVMLLPGLPAALFEECIRRMDQCKSNSCRCYRC